LIGSGLHDNLRMKASRQFGLYLILLHGTALAVAFVFRDTLGLWFFAIEAVLVISASLGIWLHRRAQAPIHLLDSFSALLEESEFTTRLSPTGLNETDQIIAVYNRMLDTLHSEYRQLGEVRGFFQQFIDTAPIGLLILDYDGAISIANPSLCGLLDRGADTLIGKRLSGLDHPLLEHLQTLETGDECIVTLDGSRRIRIQTSEFIDRGFSRQFALFEELTRVLADSEKKAYETLIRTMSHEVNNTVAATRSLLQSCLTYQDQLDTEDRQDYHTALTVAMERNQQLNLFMKAFADLVKLPEPVTLPTELGPILTQLEVMFSGECQQQNIRWVTVLPEQSVTVLLDRALFEQALINIVRNAVQAIGKNGVIQVSLATDPLRILEIRDSAGALYEEDREHLFSPFYTRREGGQGIGLALVSDILGRHGFEFDLFGKGAQTVFRIEMT